MHKIAKLPLTAMGGQGMQVFVFDVLPKKKKKERGGGGEDLDFGLYLLGVSESSGGVTLEVAAPAYAAGKKLS